MYEDDCTWNAKVKWKILEGVYMFVSALKSFVKTKKDKAIPENGDQGCLNTYRHHVDNGQLICAEELEP